MSIQNGKTGTGIRSSCKKKSQSFKVQSICRNTGRPCPLSLSQLLASLCSTFSAPKNRHAYWLLISCIQGNIQLNMWLQNCCWIPFRILIHLKVKYLTYCSHFLKPAYCILLQTSGRGRDNTVADCTWTIHKRIRHKCILLVLCRWWTIWLLK